MRHLLTTLSTGLALALGLPFGTAQAQPAPVVAIKAARLLDVAQGRWLAPAVVLVQGERITAVGSSLAIPAGAQVIDLGNRSLLPGLIDAHTHLTGAPEGNGFSFIALSGPRLALKGARNAKVTLEAGFTTVRDVGAEFYADIALRDAIDAGDVPGPRMRVSGPALGITGGHCDSTGPAPEYHVTGSGVADGVSEVMKKTREVIRYGADVIKFCATGGVLSFGDDPKASQYSPEEMKALVTEAHRLGRKVAAHAHGGDGIKLAVLAGVDSIEHGSYIDDEAMQLMKQHRTVLVPTQYLHGWLVDNAEAIKLPAAMLEKAKTTGAEARRNFSKAVAAGVPIVFGTDAAVYPHGLNAREFAVYVAAGMSPAAAIRSATLDAARLLAWDDRLGSAEAGKFADLIAVEGDPLQNVKLLETVSWVMKGGRVVKGTAR